MTISIFSDTLTNMESYKTNNKVTGWVEIPANTANVVAHYKDGTKKVFETFDYLVLNKREKAKIEQIDCYSANEQIPK